MLCCAATNSEACGEKGDKEAGDKNKDGAQEDASFDAANKIKVLLYLSVSVFAL